MINRAERFVLETISGIADRDRRIVEQAGYDRRSLGRVIGNGFQNTVYEWTDPSTFECDVVVKITRPGIGLAKAYRLHHDVQLLTDVGIPRVARTYLTPHSHLVFQESLSGQTPYMIDPQVEETLVELADFNKYLVRAHGASVDFVMTAWSLLGRGLGRTKLDNYMYTLDNSNLKLTDQGLLHFDDPRPDPYCQALALGNRSAAEFQNYVFQKYLGIELM